MLPVEKPPADPVLLPDAQLVARARTGDITALGALYERYARPMMAVAYRLLASRERAEDVLHDVFVGLPEALRKYDEHGRLEPWLKRVTARMALSALRRERTAAEVDIDAAAGVSLRPVDPEGRITLETALAALPPSQHAVLVLKEIEGFTHAEIGEMLGISKGASEVRLHRALAALRELLTKGVTR